MDNNSPNIKMFVQQLEQMNLPPVHKKFYQDFLEKGESFQVGGIAKPSALLYQYSQINNAKVKECYRNSLLLAATCDELEYVEGYMYVADIPFPIEHAWNYDRVNDLLIDTTAHVANFKFETDEYFGVTIPKDVLTKYLETTQHLTTLQYYLTQTK